MSLIFCTKIYGSTFAPKARPQAWVLQSQTRPSNKQTITIGIRKGMIFAATILMMMMMTMTMMMPVMTTSPMGGFRICNILV
jgi:hypothetical protein